MKRMGTMLALLFVLLPAFSYAASCPTLTRTLQVDARGSDVQQLQQFLVEQKLLDIINITGYFNLVTQKALQEWQKSRGIVSSGSPATTGFGVAGEKTRAAIASCAPTTQLPVVQPQSTPEPSAPTSPPTTSAAPRSLTLGMRGADVVALQQKLITLGHLSSDSATSYFGPRTQAALKAFQTANGLEPVGFVGPRTKAALAAASPSSTTPTAATFPTNNPSLASRIPSLLALLKSLQDQLAALKSGAATNVIQPNVTQPAITGGGGGGGGGNVTAPSISYAWQTGTWSACSNATQSRTVSCISSANASVAESNCAPSKPPASQSCIVAAQPTCTVLPQQTQTMSCPTGQTGSITQARTSSCATSASAPTWSAWATTTTTCTTPPASAQSCALDGLTIAHGASQPFYSARSVAYGAVCSTIAQSRTCEDGSFSGSATYQSANCAPLEPQQCTFNGNPVAHSNSVTANLASTVPFGQTCQSQTRTCTNGTLSGSFAYASCVVSASLPSYTDSGYTYSNLTGMFARRAGKSYMLDGTYTGQWSWSNEGTLAKVFYDTPDQYRESFRRTNDWIVHESWANSVWSAETNRMTTVGYTIKTKQAVLTLEGQQYDLTSQFAGGPNPYALERLPAVAYSLYVVFDVVQDIDGVPTGNTLTNEWNVTYTAPSLVGTVFFGQKIGITQSEHYIEHRIPISEARQFQAICIDVGYACYRKTNDGREDGTRDVWTL